MRKENIRAKPIHSSLKTAKEVVVKNVCTTTLSGAPVTAICDPATVRSYLLFLLSDVWVNSWFADLYVQISTDVGFTCRNGLFQPTAAGEQTCDEIECDGDYEL